MSDPYKVLGISRDATDEQVKEAYREMAKKYHPDNYQGSPIADLANEKMKEVNEAYDQIMNERKNRKNGGSSSQGYSGGYNPNYSNPNSNFADVRNLIMAGRIADAEQILNGVPTDSRNAEWYFLKGTVLYKRGWMEEAYNHFAKACDMDPSNPEYSAAYNQIKINVQVLTEDIIRAHRVKADAAVVTFAAVCCVLTVVANVLAAISSVAADESIGGCKSESYNTGCILRCIGRFGACAYVFNRIASYGNVCTAGFGGFADDYDCH